MGRQHTWCCSSCLLLLLMLRLCSASLDISDATPWACIIQDVWCCSSCLHDVYPNTHSTLSKQLAHKQVWAHRLVQGPKDKGYAHTGRVACGGHGTCTDAGFCNCDALWRGSACQLMCPNVDGVPCGGNGICNDKALCKHKQISQPTHIFTQRNRMYRWYANHLHMHVDIT
jgi:hypothetical protein